MERWLYNTLMYSGWCLYVINAILLILFRSKLETRGMGYFISYLLLSPAADIISLYVCARYGSNVWVLNIYVLLAGLMLYMFFGRQLENKERSVVYLLLGLFVVVMGLESVFYAKPLFFNKISYIYLAVTSLALGLYILFFNNTNRSFANDYSLWVSGAVVLYYGSTLLLIVVQDIILAHYSEIYYDTWYIQVLANNLINVILIIGFWRIRRISSLH